MPAEKRRVVSPKSGLVKKALKKKREESRTRPVGVKRKPPTRPQKVKGGRRLAKALHEVAKQKEVLKEQVRRTGERRPSAVREARKGASVKAGLERRAGRRKEAAGSKVAQAQGQFAKARQDRIERKLAMQAELDNTERGTMSSAALGQASTLPAVALKTGHVNVPGRNSDDIMNQAGAIGYNQVRRMAGHVPDMPTGNPHPIGGAPLSSVTAGIRHRVQGVGMALRKSAQQQTAEALDTAQPELLPTEDPTNYIFDRSMGQRFRIEDQPQVRAKPKRALAGLQRVQPGKSMGGAGGGGRKSTAPKRRGVAATGKIR